MIDPCFFDPVAKVFGTVITGSDEWIYHIHNVLWYQYDILSFYDNHFMIKFVRSRKQGWIQPVGKRSCSWLPAICPPRPHSQWVMPNFLNISEKLYCLQYGQPKGISLIHWISSPNPPCVSRIFVSEPPHRCCHLRKYYYISIVLGRMTRNIHIRWKCFRTVLKEKMW